MKIAYKLVQKSEFEYQIKNGRKVVEKIMRVSDGWYVCCVVKPDLESAITYAIESQKEMMEMFGGSVEIELSR